MHLTRNEIVSIIEEKENEEMFLFFASIIERAEKFIHYCNTQFQIIGVSHNCSSKGFKHTKDMEYTTFRHLLGHVTNTDIHSGWMTLERYQLGTGKKGRISDVKKHYLKS